MARFNPEHKVVLDELLLAYTQVRSGEMFGSPAYFAGRKVCVCLYEQGVAIKLPEASAAKLLDSDRNAKPFQPMGRPKMREWVQVDLNASADYGKYAPVFAESIHYLLAQQGMGEP